MQSYYKYLDRDLRINLHSYQSLNSNWNNYKTQNRKDTTHFFITSKNSNKTSQTTKNYDALYNVTHCYIKRSFDKI